MAKTYGDKVRIVFRQFPLNFHNNAHNAAQASLCARDQDKFWPYHDKLFDNLRTLGVENLKKYAVEVGLDADKFNACLDTGKHKAAVDADLALGQKSGVRGTPAFFVNGRFLAGAAQFNQFKELIDDELSRIASK